MAGSGSPQICAGLKACRTKKKEMDRKMRKVGIVLVLAVLSAGVVSGVVFTPGPQDKLNRSWEMGRVITELHGGNTSSTAISLGGGGGFNATCDFSGGCDYTITWFFDCQEWINSSTGEITVWCK